MFARRAILASRFQKLVNTQIVRNIRGKIKIPLELRERKSKFKQHSSKYLADVEKKNIGIGHRLRSQLEAFGQEPDSDDIDVNLLFDENALEDVSAKIDDLHDNLQHKETIKSFLAVKKKYFRPEKLPNMLTYIEKQQIMHLHKENPDYWNEYKLAEGFPASPEIIKKVIKANFVAYTVNQVLRHDETVRKNWEAFEKGELKFNDELKAIYSLFIGRSRFVTDVEEVKKYLPPPPDFAAQIPVKEMSSIITSSQKYLEQEQEQKKIITDDQGRLLYQSSARACIMDEDKPSNINQKHYTLDAFRKKINSLNNVKELDTIIARADENKQLKQANHEENEVENDKSHLYTVMNDTGVINKDFDAGMIEKLSHNIPQRIFIPAELWQKDKLYRAGDCFYTDRGYFLYRVPGLDA